mmetsp:Transcript_23907/g.54413  ORF Transcript_23907/g.54413 Transcript_23907/m.54413 type:complete len:261 (-) Transcript_23907:186-968(-)
MPNNILVLSLAHRQYSVKAFLFSPLFVQVLLFVILGVRPSNSLSFDVNYAPLTTPTAQSIRHGFPKSSLPSTNSDMACRFRREIIFSAFSLAPAYAAFPPLPAAATQSLSSARDAISIISERCHRPYLNAVITSGYKFLYRGGVSTVGERKSGNPVIAVVSERPDLLDPTTYGDDGAASSYFVSLERYMADMKSPLRPSNSHLCSLRPNIAAAWGPPMSIWPLTERKDGKDIHYAWYEEGGAFYTSSTSANGKKRSKPYS